MHVICYLDVFIPYRLMHQGNVISTPAIKGTILPGITRKSIIDVALSKGFQVITCRSHELKSSRRLVASYISFNAFAYIS